MPVPCSRRPLTLIALIAVCAAGLASQALGQTASVSVDVLLNGGNPPVAGDDSTYLISINNEGPDDASTLALSTGVPAEMTFVSLSIPAGWSCGTVPAVGSSGPIACSAATLTPGSAMLSLTVHTPRSVQQDTPITFDATVSSVTPDPEINDNIIERIASVVWISNLTLNKSAPASAAAGTTITYTITVTDSGPSDAANVSVDDPLPAPLLFQSITAPGWSCTTPPVGSNGTVSCSMSQLALGSSTITIQAQTSSSTSPMTVTNDITASATTDTASQRTASASTSIVQVADLTITKSSTALVAGNDVTYTIVVNNTGPSDAPTVVLDDPLPAALQFQSISAPGWTCSTPAVGSSGTLSCSRAVLAPGSSTLTVVEHLPSSTPNGTTVTNTATVTSGAGDPTLPNSATASGTTGLQSDLAVTIADAPDPVIAGHALAYSVNVTNNGPSAAANASLSVAIPATLGFVSLVAPGGWNCIALPPGGSGTVSCTNTSLAAAATAAFTINTTVSPSAGGGTVISTTASVSSTAADPVPGNSSATTTTTVSSPALLSATKRAAGLPFENLPITYTIVVTNSGQAMQGDNAGDELLDQLPPSLTLLSATATTGTATSDIVNNRVHWNGSIAAGASVTITIQASVNAGTAGTPISNQATVFFDADGNGTNEASALSQDVTTGGPTVFTPGPAGGVPATSDLALLLLATALAVIGIRRMS